MSDLARERAMELENEVCHLERDIARLQDENELLRDDKGCTILDQQAEIERLRADFNDCNTERARWRTEAERLRAAIAKAEDKASVLMQDASASKNDDLPATQHPRASA